MLMLIRLWCLSVCLVVLAPAVQAGGIAVISHADIAPYRAAVAGFRAQSGKPLHTYFLDNHDADQHKLAATIRQQQPELILALGKSALNFSRSLEDQTPVIFAFVLHPEKRPVHHSETGIAMAIAPEQQLKMLRAIAPLTHTVGVVYNPDKSSALIQHATAAARKLGLQLKAIPAGNQKDAAHAIASIMPTVDAMWMIPDTTVLTSTTFRQMVRLSLVHNVALIGLAPKHVRAGSLFSLSFDSYAIGQQAGRIASQPVKSHQPFRLLQPDSLKLVLNTQTAERLGLHISDTLRQQAATIYPNQHGEQK